MFCPQSSAAILPLQKQSRPVPQNAHPQAPNAPTASIQCICQRPMALVVCRRCGNDLVGRVLSPCPMHPRRIALMDLRECPLPKCRSVHLAEVQMQMPKEE